MTTDPTVTLTFDVPLSVARGWAAYQPDGTGLSVAAREAVAKWEAEDAPRYVVERTHLDNGWRVKESGISDIAAHFWDCVPDAEAEARALCERLNGERPS